MKRLTQCKGIGIVGFIALGLILSGSASAANQPTNSKPQSAVKTPPNTQANTGAQANTANQATAKAHAKAYQPRTREYYIAAEDVKWDYALSGKNKIKPGQGLGVWGKKHVYKKTRYIQYTDARYTKKVAQPKSLGILGPVIRGVVGDTIKVHFKNKASKPYSIHPIGTSYDKSDEGANYANRDYPGQSIAPGQSYTYTWHVTPDSGPGPNDPSSILRLYRSHVHPVSDLYRGLIGPIVLTRASAAKADGSPRGIDHEFFALFTIFNENGPDQDKEANLMHSINGYIFGNLPGLTMTRGDHVRWYVFGMGTEMDLHTPHWHGNGVMENGHRKEVLEVLPTVTHTVDMKPQSTGTWMFKCNIGDHIEAGMMALYHVKNK